MSAAAENTVPPNSGARDNTDKLWAILRLTLGVILLTAAILKTHQLATVPSLGEGLLQARWFNILVVEFELLFGIWLIVGLLPKLTWLATLSCFSVFTLVSLYKAVIGEANCGCWGVVEVDPKVTTIFDLGVIGLLLLFRPAGSLTQWNEMLREFVGVFRQKRFATVVVIWLLVAIPATYAMLALETVSLGENQDELAGKSVTLEPMNWIGKPFPLNDLLDAAELPKNWGVDNWTVLLHSGDCSVCEALLHELANKADSVRLDRLAVVEVPGGATVEVPLAVRERAGLVCSLRRNSRWFTPSPVVLTLENGTVAKVQIGTTARKVFFPK